MGAEAHELLSIGDVADRCGVAPSALRFYEERGLIQAGRNDAGHRVFQRAVMRRIAFIVFAQRVGLTLGEIGAALETLPENRVPTAADWERLSQSWVERVDARIRELRRLRNGLSECIGCGCLSLDQCTLVNPGDALAARGPGPHRWMADCPGPGGGA